MKRKLTALLLALCMSLTCLLPVASAANTTPPSPTDVVIDVSEYGVYPDGSDSAPGIALAVQAATEASKSGKTVTIRFPKGSYDIYPDKIAEREFYISNTVGQDGNHKMKKIAILLEGVKNVTVDGQGSTLISHGKLTPFAVVDSQNVTFQNFTSTFKTPTVVDVTVEKAEGNKAVVYIPECYNYRLDGTSIEWRSDVSPYTNQPYWVTRNGMNYTQDFDAVNGLTWRGGNQLFNNVTGLKDLGNNRVEFTYSRRDGNVQPGRCYQMRTTVRDHAGAFLWKSKDVAIRNVNFDFLHGFGIVGQHSENITLDTVDFSTALESGRTTAGYADFIQMSGCKGLIDIGHCTFSNPHDDPINVHGTFNQVVERIADNKVKVRFMHNETAGFPNFFVGDEIEFCSKQTLLPLNFTAKVTAVDGPDGMGGNMGAGSGSKTDIILTLDKPIPSQVQANAYVVENITYTPSVHIHDNLFKETPTRGILVTTRKPVIIENNRFDGMGMAGIYISCDNNGWYESGHTEDVIIRSNVFTRGKDKAIFVEPTNPQFGGPIHKNLTIENNTFYLEQGGSREVLVDAKCVENLTIRNNKIYRQDPNVALNITAGKTALNAGETQQLGLTKSGASFANRLYNLRGCKNVTISGNQYDGGLNAGTALYNGTAVSDVTITDDVAANNASNIIDPVGQIYYVSDNKEAVVVSDAGLVQAVGAGTANVTVYAVTGGRKYQGNTLTFTVSGAQTEGPTAITIAGAGKTAGETIQFTAAVTAPENASKTVTWRVVDAKTGAETAAASINDAGLLTPAASGAVEVIATTVNGLTARQLVLIQLPEHVLSSGIEIENPQPDHMKILGENRIQLETINGGLYQEQVPGNVVKVPLTAEDTAIIIKLEGRPNNGWEDAGLYLYKDQNNYVAIQRKHRGDHAEMGVVNEKARTAQEKLVADASAENLYLKLEKTGSTVKASYSADKQAWTEIQTVTNDGLTGPLFAAFAATHNNSNNRHAFVFTELTVNDAPVALTARASAPAAEKPVVTYDPAANTATVNAAADILRWEIAPAADGTYTLLEGRGAALTTTAAMKNQYIRAVAIAQTAAGLVGEAAYSEPVLVTGDGAAENNAEDGTALPALGGSNADLAVAEITGLKTGFAPFRANTLGYYTTAGVDETSMHLHFAAADPAAKVEVKFNGKPVAADADVPLHNARNLAEVKVTAENGITFKEYRFTVSRTGSSAVSVKGITLNGQPIANFSADKMAYDFQLEEGQTTLDVAVEADAASLMIALNGRVFTGNAASFDALADGENVLLIRATAANGVTEKMYRVTIRKPYDSNAVVQSVAMNGKEILPALHADKTSLVYVAGPANMLAAAAQDPRAQVKLLRGSKVLAAGVGHVEAEIQAYDNAKQFTVEVTAVDGTTKTSYTMDLAKGAYLSDLAWVSESCGWQSTQKDKNIDGNTLEMVGPDGKSVAFAKGLGTHAESTIVYDVAGKGYTAITGYAGLDYAEYNARYGSVQFQIFADDAMIFDSAVMRQKTPMKKIDAKLPDGTQRVTLKALKSDDDNWNDHANWADIQFAGAFGQTIEIDEAVEQVEAMIAALGEIDLTKEEAVKAARAAFNKLTPAQQAKVGNIDKLNASEAALATMYKMNGASLSIGGNVAVNFFFDLSEQMHQDASVVLTVEDGLPLTLPAAEAVKTDDGYKFTASVPVRQMNSRITIQLVKADTVLYMQEFSVRNYADSIQKGDYDAATKHFVQAMLYHGAAMQQFKGYNTDNLPTAGLDMTEMDKAAAALTAADLDAYQPTVSGKLDGLALYGVNLSLHDETTLRYFFAKGDAYQEGAYHFTVNGKPAKAAENGDFICVEVDNIAASRLDDMVNLTVNGDALTVSYAPLSYARSVMQDSKADAKLDQVARSLYLYNAAANALTK